MKGQQWIAVAILVAALTAAIMGAAWQGPSLALGNVIGLIRIEGPIMGGSGSESLLDDPAATADRLVKALRTAAQDDRVKAVVIRINSPGGSPSAAYEISAELKRLREAGKQVVISMGDLAASAGYYIAANGDYILATPDTLTGSIGVILETANLEELYDKIGYHPITIKSGEHKDIGSAARPMTDVERAMLQEIVMDSYQRFLQVVIDGRKDAMTPEEVKAIADGRIFTGAQAHELGLVDELGSLQDAYRKAAELAGLAEDDYTIEEFGKTNPFEEFLGLPQALVRLAGILERGPAALFSGQGDLPRYR